MRRRITRLIGAFLSIAERFVPPAAPQLPTFVAVMTNAAAGATVAVTKDAAVQDGDVLIAVVWGNALSTPTFLGSTWTAFGGVFTAGGNRGLLFWRLAASEGATWTARVLTATAIRCTIGAFRTVDPVNPIGASDRTVYTSAATAFATPSIVPAAVNSLLLCLTTGVAGTSWTAPAGFTERADDSATMSIGAFDLVQASTDSVSATATASGATVGVAALIALTPAAA